VRAEEPRPPVLTHSVYSLMARGSMLLARGLGLILISRRLGGEHFGVYALLLATYSLCASVGAFGIEQTSLYLVGRRQKRLPVLVGNSLLLALFCGLPAALLCFGTVTVLRDRFFTGATWEVAALTALGLPIGIAHNALVGLAVGLGRFRYYGFVELCKWLAYLALVGLFYVRSGLSVFTSLGSFFAVLLGASLVHLAFFTFRLHARPTPCLRLLRRMLAMGRRMLLVQLTSVLALRLDVYAVRFFGAMGLVGTYALATHLGEILMYVARSFAMVVFSGTARGSRPAALRLGLLVGALVMAAVCLALGVVFLREGVLVALFGETSRGCVPSLLVRMPGVLAAAIALLIAGELLGRGRADVVVRAYALAVFCAVVLFWPLCRWDTALGAATAFSVASTAQALWMAVVLKSARALQAPREASLGAMAPSLAAE
jgi:O-antigen/teichoic acid export membrane protein